MHFVSNFYSKRRNTSQEPFFVHHSECRLSKILTVFIISVSQDIECLFTVHSDMDEKSHP